MLEKNLIKLIRSLEHKKYRKRNNLFVAEGHKVVGDLMQRIKPYMIIATSDWEVPKTYEFDFKEVCEEELGRVSFLQNPQHVLGLFPIPQEQPIADMSLTDKLVIVLDGIQDPGNLGTIIRIADWFDIDTIICSNDTTDVYNPKVVQATMGSLARVSIAYTNLNEMLEKHGSGCPVYGTLLDGENIYDKELGSHGFIIMGNEGNGISASVRERITDKLLIPTFHKGDTAESLNVAIATAITCSEFRRRQLINPLLLAHR